MDTQRKKATFETFNDGNCQIHLIDEDGNAGTLVETLRYQERTVGVKRYYEAMTAKVQVDRLIRVPFRPWLTTEYLVSIEKQVYEIRQVQTIPDSMPKTKDISLHLSRQRVVSDGTA